MKEEPLSKQGVFNLLRAARGLIIEDILECDDPDEIRALMKECDNMDEEIKTVEKQL